MPHIILKFFISRNYMGYFIRVSDHDMMPSSVRMDIAPSAVSLSKPRTSRSSAFAILCAVFSKNERLNAILIQHTGSLHRFFIFHNILFVNKQKQEKYICLKLHIEKSDCHPLS